MIATYSKLYSEIFDVKVGTLDINPPIYSYDVKAANKGLFDVVFVKSEAWVDPHGDVVALDYLYDMELMAGREVGKPTTSYQIADVEHVKIAQTSFKDSRFLRDPLLCQNVERMFAGWISRKLVHVLDGAPLDAFLYESADEDGARRISLLAVKESCRSLGLGKLLVSRVMETSPTALWRVKVSCRNYRAVRFYESIGFRVKSVSTAFHVWVR
jgi:ribosomal protein S18 acetylase RimI-like enzyme